MLNICAEKFQKILDKNEIIYNTDFDTDGNPVFQVRFLQDTLFFLTFSGEDGTDLLIECVFQKIPENKVLEIIVYCTILNRKLPWLTFFVTPEHYLFVRISTLLNTADNPDEHTLSLALYMAETLNKYSSLIQDVIDKGIQ